MPGLADSFELLLECPKCGVKLKGAPLERLERERSIACAKCGLVHLSGDRLAKLRTAFDQLESELAKLRATIKPKS